MVHEVKSNTAQAAPLDPRLFLRDEELDRGIRLVLGAQGALEAAARRAREEAGFSLMECRILMALRVEPGLTVSALREELGATTPSFARWIGRLDKRGLLRKARGGQDARQRRMSLSETGVQATDAVSAAMRDAMRKAYREAGADCVAGARAVLEALTR